MTRPYTPPHTMSLARWMATVGAWMRTPPPRPGKPTEADKRLDRKIKVKK